MTRIELDLGSNIVYVGGTINEQPYVFRLETGKWVANADSSRDSAYHILLTLQDEAGNVSRYENTLYYEMPWFVTDRTEEDIKNRTWKAYLNAEDLNRIERDAGIVAELLQLPAQVKSWEVGGLPRESDFARILDNVRRIRNYGHKSTTPPVPARPLNHFAKVNAVEQILADAFEIYVGKMKNIIYAGEIYAGEFGGL